MNVLLSCWDLPTTRAAPLGSRDGSGAGAGPIPACPSQLHSSTMEVAGQEQWLLALQPPQRQVTLLLLFFHQGLERGEAYLNPNFLTFLPLRSRNGSSGVCLRTCERFTSYAAPWEEERDGCQRMQLMRCLHELCTKTRCESAQRAGSLSYMAWMYMHMTCKLWPIPWHIIDNKIVVQCLPMWRSRNCCDLS